MINDQTFLAFTNLGDSAVTFGFASALALYLFYYKQRPAFLTLVVSYVATGVCIALGKFFIYSHCSLGEMPLTLHSPSGHSALSLVAYGLFGFFVSSSLQGWRRFVPPMIVFPIVALISASRILLGYHTFGDVVSGLLAGAIIGLIAWRFFMRGKSVCCPWIPFMLASLAFLSLLYGKRIPAEDYIELLSGSVKRSLHSC